MNRYGYSSVGRFDVFFRNQLLVFQQHQDESLYDSWTRFKDIIRKVLNHDLSIWTLIEIFLKHLDSLSWHIINLTAEGDLRKFSDIGAWNTHRLVTYPEEVEKTLGTPIEVEPLNETKLEESLDVSLGDVIGPEPPIKPHSPDSSRMKVIFDEKKLGKFLGTSSVSIPSLQNQQVKTPRENVKSQNTHSQKPKVDKKELGHGFAVRACFVCGSLNHLIRASSTKNFSTARQSFNRQTVLTNTAMKVNTVKPIVNRVRPANVFHKTHSPTRPFKKTTVLKPVFTNQKFNTAKDYPHRALKNKGIVDSGCSRHMTGNKAYLDEFQDFNGGPVAFGGSRGYITGKGVVFLEVVKF
ncbi:hypothetical protein Tco_1159816 [Tanacetum coccineum]